MHGIIADLQGKESVKDIRIGNEGRVSYIVTADARETKGKFTVCFGPFPSASDLSSSVSPSISSTSSPSYTLHSSLSATSSPLSHSSSSSASPHLYLLFLF